MDVRIYVDESGNVVREEDGVKKIIQTAEEYQRELAEAKEQLKTSCKYCGGIFYSVEELDEHVNVCKKQQYAKLQTIEEKLAFIEKELGLR